MFNIFKFFTDVATGTMRYFRSLGSGRAVSVLISGEDLERVTLVFQKNIEKGDVCEGKLISSVLEEVKHRGGKRTTSLDLTYESAEALHRVLKLALKDMRKRRSRDLLEKYLLFTMLDCMQSKQKLFPR